MKKCKKCKLELPEDSFYKGQGYRCKACSLKHRLEYANSHQNEVSQNKKRYYNETIIERRNKKRLEKYGATKEERKIKSRELERLRSRNYYILNKEKQNAYSKEYAIKNRKIVNEKLMQKLKENNTFRLATRLRTLIYWHLKRKSIKNQGHSFELTGCTPLQLKLHLESLFLPGMSWSNHTVHGWHIDHKIPCSKFDLTKESEQYKCFHYSNLQPLWAVDNRRKGNKLIGQY